MKTAQATSPGSRWWRVVLPAGAIFALAAGLLLTGCGTGAGPTPAAGGVQKVQVAMTDVAIKPNPASVPAGEVTFTVTNTGTETHEFIVLKTDLAPNALKKSAADPTRVDEDASGQKIGELEDLQPGQSKDLTLSLMPGKYVLFCNISGHYERGMRSAFEVK